MYYAVKKKNGKFMKDVCESPVLRKSKKALTEGFPLKDTDTIVKVEVREVE